jgi:hypothetical protein
VVDVRRRLILSIGYQITSTYSFSDTNVGAIIQPMHDKDVLLVLLNTVAQLMGAFLDQNKAGGTPSVDFFVTK